jgi:hypothetical protein
MEVNLFTYIHNVFDTNFRNFYFMIFNHLNTQGFCSPYFTVEFRPHSQWKIESFFPKIGQIIPKLIGVIVCKNQDLVTISGNVFYITQIHIRSSVRFSSRFFVHSVVILFWHKHVSQQRGFPISAHRSGFITYFSKCIQTSLLDEYHPCLYCLCGKELFIYMYEFN